MLNPECIIASWNAGAEQLKRVQTGRDHWQAFFHFYSAEAIREGFPKFELNQALEQGRFEDKGWRIRKDGTAFWANVVITPVFNATNRLLGFAKITRDLIKRHRNQELMLKNKELARINNDLDNFVYTASHSRSKNSDCQPGGIARGVNRRFRSAKGVTPASVNFYAKLRGYVKKSN